MPVQNKVLIIAEAGVNHNGDVHLALKLCDAAKEAGADVVKFQTFDTEHNVCKDCGMADYQAKNVKHKSHWQMIKDLELTHDEFRRVKQHCGKIGIKFLSTPSEVRSLRFLMSLGMDTIKISSGEITNLPFLRAIAKQNKKIIMSTGMATLGEVASALSVLTKAGMKKNNIILMHCTTSYPTKMADVNLRAMVDMGKRFGVAIGYSDHTTGRDASVAAVALGAVALEKHLTLSKKMKGPDHKASLDPKEFASLVAAVRDMEAALGDGVKRPTPEEKKIAQIARKTIVAARPIRKGEIFSEENITVKRPAFGLSPMQWDRVIGKKARRDYRPDEAIRI